MHKLVDPITQLLRQISALLELVTDEEYVEPIKVLSGATLGQHTRHILEFYLELNAGYAGGTLNYDARKRDRQIETNRIFTIERLAFVLDNLHKDNKPLEITADYGYEEGDSFTISSNYERELMYNLEHTVHHMALLRIGVNALQRIKLPDSFGVAVSTINYRKVCAQ